MMFQSVTFWKPGFLACSCLAFLMLQTCNLANGALTYELGLVAGTSTVLTNETITVQIVIREFDDGTGSNPTTLLANGDALSAFSGQIVRDSGDGVLSNLVIDNAFIPTGAVPTTNPTVSDGLIAFNYASFSGGLTTVGGGSSLVVGTFDFTGGFSDTILRTDDIDTIANDLVIGPFGPSGRFDSLSDFEALTFSSVTAVPEPISLSFLTACGCGIFALSRSRHRRKTDIQ